MSSHLLKSTLCKGRIGFLMTVSFLTVFILAGFSPVHAALNESDTGTIIYEGRLEAEQLSWIRDEDGTYTPELPDSHPLAETDQPLLPVRDLLILIPLEMPITGVEVLPVATHRVPLPGQLRTATPLISSEGRTIRVDQLPRGETTFPTLWGEFGGSHTWRGFRLVSVRLFPVRVVRAGKKSDGADGAATAWTALEIMDRFTVRIVRGKSGELPDVAQRHRLVPGERQRAEALLQRLLANPEALAGYDRPDGTAVPAPANGFQPTRTPNLSGSAVTHLIVTTEELAASFQLLADHKTAQGLPSLVVTTEWIGANFRHGADTQETLRMFIREAYEKWGIEYLLIGGDTDIIPVRYVTNTYHTPEEPTDIPVDIYYSCLDGNWNGDGDHLYGEPYEHFLQPGDYADLAEELFIGRATVSSPAAAAVFVDKVITYTEALAGSGWTNRTLFAAEELFDSVDGAFFTEQLFNAYLVPCTGMDSVRMYENWQNYPGSVPLTRVALIDSLNTAHYGIFNQMGHGFYFNMSLGDANFTTADADALVNGDHQFLMFAVNCASAAFDFSCLMERLLQNPNGGSMASIGSSRAAFPFSAHEYQKFFFDSLFCQGENRLGRLMTIGRMAQIGSTFLNTVHRWTYLNFTLLGDPSLAIWTAAPAMLQITAPGSLNAGAQNVTVTVQRGGSPVVDALVCLTKDGDDYAYGTTDAAGQVVLPFTPTSGGEAILTVTGTNVAFSRQSIAVSSGVIYVAVTGVQLHDDGSAGSAGNGNSVAEAGETIAMYVECQDTGGGGATGCTATLASNTPGITILDGTAYVGNVPAAGVKLSDEPFLYAIDADVRDGRVVDFDLVVTDGEGNSYESGWTETLLAPETEPVALVWSDAEYGNGDGILDDNERVTVTATLKNFGAGVADQLTATLRTIYPHISLYDTVVTYTDLALLEQSNGNATFSLSDENVTIDSWCWILYEDNHGRTFRHDFHLRPPSVPDGLETDTSVGPDVIALRWAPVVESGVRGYNVYRAVSGNGPFAKVNVDLVDGVSYFQDEGLELMTRYYYRTATVDSSLVEGHWNSVVSASTSPPELPNYPLPFALETSGHCAVGDVDGDGFPEIVLGADEIYVWKADGSELIDGDMNPLTHGPFTNLDSDFEPAGIALAQLDGLAGLEIVAAERHIVGQDQTANQIHIFRADGSELPGWPQALRAVNNGWPWTTPAVGDVDGDGESEIVVNTQDGRTWVWHADGSELLDGDGNPTTNGIFYSRGIVDWCRSSPALFDLDGDGAKEIIFGTRYSGTMNYLYAFKSDTTQAPGFPYLAGNDARIMASPTVADLNGDGTWEIIFQSQNNFLHVVQQDGSTYPGFPRSFESNRAFAPSAAVGDFDGDGELEIVAATNITLLESRIYVIDTDIDGGTSGETLPGWPQALPGLSEASPVVGDIDGDGNLDVLFGIGGSHEEAPNQLSALAATGNLVAGFPIALGGPVRSTPFICDLDRDGDVDIVFGGGDRLIHVWDMPNAFDATKVPWPTFRGHVYRDGVRRPLDLVDVPEPTITTELLMPPPHPNPFNPTTQVRLHVPSTPGSRQQVTVGVYDLRGRRVRVLHDGSVTPGWHTWVWDGRDENGRGQSSGVYFMRARSDGGTTMRKVMLVK